MADNMSKDKLIILDRDGVINYDSDNYIKSAEEWIPIEGSLEAIAQLNKLGYKVAVATNQSGIARGLYDLNTLESMHNKMQQLLAGFDAKIDYIAFCPHGPNDSCPCRKPKPGMLLEIADYFSIQTEEITFIGDTDSDMKAAENAKMNFVLVRTGKGEKTISNCKTPKHIETYDSLNSFVDKLEPQAFNNTPP